MDPDCRFSAVRIYIGLTKVVAISVATGLFFACMFMARIFKSVQIQ